MTRTESVRKTRQAQRSNTSRSDPLVSHTCNPGKQIKKRSVTRHPLAAHPIHRQGFGSGQLMRGLSKNRSIRAKQTSKRSRNVLGWRKRQGENGPFQLRPIQNPRSLRRSVRDQRRLRPRTKASQFTKVSPRVIPLSWRATMTASTDIGVKVIFHLINN